MTASKKCPTPDPVCNRIVSRLRCPRRVSISFVDAPSMTRQEFKDECDINQIMRRYYKTGVISHVNKYQGVYGDCPASDFTEAVALVERAEGMFSELPAHVRKRFENDPAQFLAFVEDESNREEAVLLGLIEVPADLRTATAPEPPAQEE